MNINRDYAGPIVIDNRLATVVEVVLWLICEEKSCGQKLKAFGQGCAMEAGGNRQAQRRDMCIAHLSRILRQGLGKAVETSDFGDQEGSHRATGPYTHGSPLSQHFPRPASCQTENYFTQLAFRENHHCLIMASFPNDCLPPEYIYHSQDELFIAINAWAVTRGYKFIIRRSVVEKSGRHTVTYICDRFRQPPSPSRELQRKSSINPRGTGCQFNSSQREWAELWIVKHRIGAQFCQHNHEPRPQQPSSLRIAPQSTPPLLAPQPSLQPASLQQALEEPSVLGKAPPTCSECHIQGRRRGAKSCPLKGDSS